MTDHKTDVGSTGPAGYADEVVYGERSIAFEVVRTGRSTLGICVHPSGRVEVRAPLEADAGEVRERVQRRARWILRHQRRFAELVQDQPEKEYVGGETHRYLGRQYRLKVIPIRDAKAAEVAGPREDVRLVGRYFEVHTAQPDDPTRTRTLLDGWYRRQAERRLRDRFQQGCALVAKYGIAPPPLQIRRMQRRWGSCTPKGRVLLNPRLVLAPTPCIDYVVVHELCHTRHPHHGRDFYHLLIRVMPDWEERKARLERVQ